MSDRYAEVDHGIVVGGKARFFPGYRQ